MIPSVRGRSLRNVVVGVAFMSVIPAMLIAQATDTTRTRTRPRSSGANRDSAATVLSPINVRASIIPAAGPSIGSGVPARVTTLTGRDVNAWSPRLLSDALASQAGISTFDDLGSPFKINLNTRGFSAGPTVGIPVGVSVFLDGVRQNEPDAQEVNFDLLPMHHVERVEVLSGTASLLGPNSLGGAINLVTNRGEGPPSGEIEATSSSFGAYSAEGRASGATANGFDYYATAGYGHERGWRDATGGENVNAFVNLGRRGPRRGISLQAYGVRSRAETAGSIPESLFESSPETNFTAGDFENANAQQLTFSGYTPMWSGNAMLTAYVRRSQAERFNVNQAPDPDVRGFTSNLTVGTNADWRWAMPIGASALALRSGVDAAVNRVTVRIFNEASDGAPGGEEPDDASGLTTHVRSPSLDLASYAIADWRFGRVTVSAAGRYDFVRVPFENRIVSADRTTNDYRHFSPRAGVSVDVASGLTAYASVGRSFRAPAILELGCADPDAACPLPFALGEDPPLQPVRATTYEAGGRWTAGRATLSASAYRTNVRDEIFFVASPRALLSGYFTNLPKTRREGVEVAAQTSLWNDRLSAYANYAWTHATFRTPAQLFSIRSDDEFQSSGLAGANDVEAGDALPLVPAHQAKAGAVARLGGGVTLGANARYIGRQWLRGDEANETSPLSPYTVADVRASYAVRGWEVTTIITNLFDSHSATFGTFNENRQTGALERFLTPLNARTFKITLTRRFGRA